MTDLLTAEEIEKTLLKCLDEKPDRITNYELEPKSDSAVGYMANHLSLTVQYLAGRKEHRKRFFVKTFEDTDRENYFLDETGIFQREVDFYSVFVEDMRKYAGDKPWCPAYCFSKPRVLVLEDLSDSGFEMPPDDITLDEAHLKCALETLARMHACSIFLENETKTKCLLTEYHPLLREIIYVENKPESASAKWISWQIKDLLLAVQYLKKYTEEEKDFIRGKLKDQIMRIYPLNKPFSKLRNVLIHGDIWKNNLMFRYENGSPCDCRLVDFQFSRYASPAHDVMHFLHLASRKVDRDEKENFFIRHYYDSLNEEFKFRGKTLEYEFTFEAFAETCTVYKELGLIQSLLSLHYIMGPVTLEVDKSNYKKYEEYLNDHRHEYMEQFFKRESYAEKITEVMTELIDHYIIKR